MEEIDRLVGLEAGADNYICKPFSPREVIARTRTIMRRVDRAERPAPGSGFVINDDNFTISLNATPPNLTQSEFVLMSALVRKPGRVYSRDALLDKLGTQIRDVSDRGVDSHIKNLRRKIARVDDNHEYICSVYGVGYKFEA